MTPPTAGRPTCSAASARPTCSCAIRPIEPWPAAERLQREYDAVGFFLSGHPLDEYGDVLKKLRVQTWVEFCRAVKGGDSVGRVAATVLDRQERRTKTGNKMGILTLSDQTGHFEAILFQEGLQQYRDMLEPGSAVVLMLQAGLEGDEVRARIGTAEPLDEAVAKLPEGHAHLPARRAPDRQRLRAPEERGEGEVSLVLILEDGEREVEVKLPDATRPRRRSPARCGPCRAWWTCI